MTKEQLVSQIVEECKKNGEPVTIAEATEMAEMEKKSNSNHRYEKSTNKRKAAQKERKIDETKKKLLSGMKVYVEGSGGTVTSIKNESEFTFTYSDGNSYTVKLIKHRNK